MQRKIPPSAVIANSIDQLYRQPATQDIAEELNQIYRKLTSSGSASPGEDEIKLKNLYGKLLEKTSVAAQSTRDIKAAINEMLHEIKSEVITEAWETKYMESQPIEEENKQEEESFASLKKILIDASIPFQIGRIIENIDLDDEQKETVDQFNKLLSEKYTPVEDSYDQLTTLIIDLQRMLNDISYNYQNKEAACENTNAILCDISKNQLKNLFKK